MNTDCGFNNYEDYLDDFIFSFNLSSGSDVLICYDQSTQVIYDIFSTKLNPSDIEIFRYTTFMNVRVFSDRDKKKLLKDKLRKSISDFIADFRNGKIDDILNHP